MKKWNLIFLLIGFNLIAQNSKKPIVDAIVETDLKTDMYQIAADQFNGREAGTLDELKVSMWLADKAKSVGMQAAGENGTFFQFFNMYRHQVSPTSTISINGKKLVLWKDILVADVVRANLEADVVYLGPIKLEELSKQNIEGKVVAIQASTENISTDISLFERRYPGFVKNKYYEKIQKMGAKGLILITDALSEKSWEQVLPQMTRGLFGIQGIRDKVPIGIPVLWMKKENLAWLQSSKIKIDLQTETYQYPSVNIIGKIEGTDPKLKKEYVLISGHQDHDGVRNKYGQDSIYNGADDNASACVAMLAMARAYKKQASKRSILFVFHGAEERGLLGSRWHANHPMVPKESIVAVLNADMIGRNHINEAALLGSNLPHKNSDDLVNIALAANEEGPKFQLNRYWDSPEHPEYFYFRSDHLPYAKVGIPAIFFTSVLHADYHTPMDESERIDYKKLLKMTQWMYRTSWKVANQTDKPKLLPDFKLER